MRILLINPPYQRLNELHASVSFPTGLGYIASVLDQAGYHVRIYDANLSCKEDYPELTFTKHVQNHHKLYDALVDKDHHVWREVSDILHDFQPDLVGITSVTITYPVARKVASLVKEYSSDCPVVIGGSHATVCAESVLKDGSFDYVVRGEGEQTLLELVQFLEEDTLPLREIAGLSYLQNGNMWHNPPRSFINNLDSIPYPRRELLINYELYLPWEACTIITGRACPHSCTFCTSRALWGRKVRFRSLPNVIEEIKYLATLYEQPYIYFIDDTFTLDRRRVEELCTSLLSEGVRVPWDCATRADLVNDEICQRMREAGCRTVGLGVESGSERILRRIKKRVTIDDIRRAVKILKRNGLTWDCFFMVGFPDETAEEMRSTEEVMKELHLFRTTLNIFAPLPGSELYEECMQKGFISHEPDRRLFDSYAPEVSVAVQIPGEKFKEIVMRMFATVDKLNRRESSKWRHIWRFKAFYIRHPLCFLKRVWSFVKRHYF